MSGESHLNPIRFIRVWDAQSYALKLTINVTHDGKKDLLVWTAKFIAVRMA